MKKILILLFLVNTLSNAAEEKIIFEDEQKVKKHQKTIHYRSCCRKCPRCYYYIRYKYWEDQRGYWAGQIDDSFYDHFTR